MKLLVITLMALAVLMRATAAQDPPPIADNSFLLEESYNQEPGVVQHINALLRIRNSWTYAFIQEWPLGGRRDQLSYTIPIQSGLEDVALNYRRQVFDGAIAVAPRLSVILPTGSASRAYGIGAVAVQTNVPASIAVGTNLVTHWNAGVTFMPATHETIVNLGASAIWLVRPMINVMLETSWVRARGGTGDLLLSPGMRWAHNVRGGLQIVPGIAFPIGVGPSAGERGVLVYLSFEHPFTAAARARAR